MNSNSNPELGSNSDDPKFVEFQKVIENMAKAVSAGNTTEAERMGMQTLMFAGEEAMQHPTPKQLAQEEARRCEESADWAGAETAWLKALELSKGESSPAHQVKPHLDVSGFFGLLGRWDEAWAHANAAVTGARGANIPPLLVMSLRNQAACALKRGDSATALAAAKEAVDHVKPGPMSSPALGRSLVLRARCLLASGDLAAAERDLATAFDLLSPMTDARFMAGLQSGIAQYWQVRGALLSTQGKPVEAKEAWACAVDLYRQIAQLPQVEKRDVLSALSRSLEGFRKVLQELGDNKLAEQTATEVESIGKQLGLPKN